MQIRNGFMQAGPGAAARLKRIRASHVPPAMAAERARKMRAMNRRSASTCGCGLPGASLARAEPASGLRVRHFLRATHPA
jgi:hypothetical protein